MKKRVLTVLLAVVMVFSLVPAALAVDLEPLSEEFAEDISSLELFRSIAPSSVSLNRFDSFAADLQSLNLFRGVAPSNLQLNRAPTRAEALVMLIRLLGVEEAAQNSNYEHPFTDADMWARNYIAYAYANGLTTGTTETTFSPNAAASAQMYVTFALRALGYEDPRDFTFANALEFGMRGDVGVWDPILEEGTFTRGHMVAVSYLALAAWMADESGWLIDVLVAEGAVSATAAAPIIAQIEAYDDYHFLVYDLENRFVADGTSVVTMNLVATYAGETFSEEIVLHADLPDFDELLLTYALPFTTLVLITEVSRETVGGNTVLTMNLRDAYLMSVIELLAEIFIEEFEEVLELPIDSFGSLTGFFEEQIIINAAGEVVSIVVEEDFSFRFVVDGVTVDLSVHWLTEIEVA